MRCSCSHCNFCIPGNSFQRALSSITRSQFTQVTNFCMKWWALTAAYCLGLVITLQTWDKGVSLRYVLWMASCNFWCSQRTILSQLLFLLYINDIADKLTSNVALFADDCVLFKEVQTKGDQSKLQNDLTKLRIRLTVQKAAGIV